MVYVALDPHILRRKINHPLASLGAIAKKKPLSFRGLSS